MISPNYPNPQQEILPIYQVQEEAILSSSSPSPTQANFFLYNLSLLKDKLHQVESLATIIFLPSSSSLDHHIGHPPESTPAVAIPSMATLIQEIIVTASSMMFSCQQMSLGPPAPNNNAAAGGVPLAPVVGPSVAFFSNHQDTVDHDHWYGYNNYNSNEDNYNSTSRSSIVDVGNTINSSATNINSHPKREITNDGPRPGQLSPLNYDIVELNAADLLAKYTHYCQVCGKGFKRDANLRMHMRAHGEQYKSSAALMSPSKNRAAAGEKNSGSASMPMRKYSCPHEGCRWNKNHAKFQPLKSMICVKNHYKRSHCPKIYVCKRCNRKQFSVLSDLRTHEKHCGDSRWECSCGTTFSRKDKLMGHVAVFVGHMSAVNYLNKVRNGDENFTKMQLDVTR